MQIPLSVNRERESGLNLLGIVVELLGSFLFLVAIMLSGGNPWIIGATLAVLIWFSTATSGGYFNPAVTIATLLNNGLTVANAVGYIIAQLTGALLAVVIVNKIKKGG